MIIEEMVVKRHQDGKTDDRVKKLPIPNNIVVLRENGIKTLYHFTDVSNLDSIRAHGLSAWRKIESEKIKCKMNSSVLSHRLDVGTGLADYIRLSFCHNTP